MYVSDIFAFNLPLNFYVQMYSFKILFYNFFGWFCLLCFVFDDFLEEAFCLTGRFEKIQIYFLKQYFKNKIEKFC